MLRREEGRDESSVYKSTTKSVFGKDRRDAELEDFVVERVAEKKPVVPFSMEALRDQIESQALNSESKMLFTEPKLAGDIFGSETRPSSKQERPRNGNFDNFPFFEMQEVKKSASRPPRDEPESGPERKTGFIFDDIISQFTKPPMKHRPSSASTLNVDQVDRMNESRLNRLSAMQGRGFGREIEETDIIDSFLKREGSREGRLEAHTTFKDMGVGRAGVSVFPE
jgi:hypothetical protein